MIPRNAIIGTSSSDAYRWSVASGNESRENLNESPEPFSGEVVPGSNLRFVNKSMAADPQVAEAGSTSSLKAQVQRCIGSELVHVEKLIRDATASRYEEVAELAQAAAAMGGKRLRPTLVWLSAQAISGSQPSRSAFRDLSSIAAAVELVHAASLVHDDVMDDASYRRHQLTIAGKSGNSAAVLLGDLLFTRGYALAASCRSTYPARLIAIASTRLCEGELRQQAAVGHWRMTYAHYRSLLLQKTGALCGVSCQLGSWRAGADVGQVRSLTKFGRQLGLAFQIYDDWLDYWGTDDVGKTLGTDLVQSKPTLPMLRLMRCIPPERQAELIELLNAPAAEARQTVLTWLDASDAGEYTLRIARRCSDKAKCQLLALPPSPAREALAAVADYSVRRQV